MPELVVGQAGKELTHNQALAVLDQLAQAVVIDKDLTAPPGSPANGSMYIVAAGATGAWSGQSGKLAYWLTTVAAWTFITPANGWFAWVADEAKRYERAGGVWVLSTVALGLGTAATANVTTSTTDTTAGSMLKVGDFGLGQSAGTDNTPTWPATSLNDCTGAAIGFWRTIGTTTDRPPGFTTACTLIFNKRQFASGVAVQYSQLVIDNGAANGAMAFRVSSGAGTLSAPLWGTWQELWTSGGTNAVTSENGSFGYSTGSGATAVQPTSKATGVPLNKPSGQITTASDAIAANSAVSFTLANNKIAANDIPKIVIKSGATAGAYVVQVDAVAAGSCRISIRNMTGGSLSETLVLQFNIEKGAVA